MQQALREQVVREIVARSVVAAAVEMTAPMVPSGAQYMPRRRCGLGGQWHHRCGGQRCRGGAWAIARCGRRDGEGAWLPHEGGGVPERDMA
jgi:hypothetical protein